MLALNPTREICNTAFVVVNPHLGVNPKYEQSGVKASRKRTRQQDKPKVEKKPKAEKKPKIELECVICLEDIKGRHMGNPSVCKHNFCVKCITSWAKKHDTCPIDRAEFQSINIVKKTTGELVRQTDRNGKKITQPFCATSTYEIAMQPFTATIQQSLAAAQQSMATTQQSKTTNQQSTATNQQSMATTQPSLATNQWSTVSAELPTLTPFLPYSWLSTIAPNSNSTVYYNNSIFYGNNSMVYLSNSDTNINNSADNFVVTNNNQK